MERRQNRNLGKARSPKQFVIMMIFLFAISGIIAYTVSYISYSKKIAKQDKTENDGRFSNENSTMLNVISKEEIAEVNSKIGKTVNEIENTQESTIENSEIQMELLEEKLGYVEEEEIIAKEDIRETNNVETTNNEEKSQEDVEQEEEKVDFNFIKPVEGEIIKNYSSDNLIYSETLQEWTTHLGIDYAAEKTSIVKATARGIIKSIKNDPRYGLTIIIEHGNGFTSMYSNLLTTEFVKVGEEVTAGQTIATVGNTATFEIADETHLHFELLKDGKNVDPNLYIR